MQTIWTDQAAAGRRVRAEWRRNGMGGAAPGPRSRLTAWQCGQTTAGQERQGGRARRNAPARLTARCGSARRAPKSAGWHGGRSAVRQAEAGKLRRGRAGQRGQVLARNGRAEKDNVRHERGMTRIRRDAGTARYGQASAARCSRAARDTARRRPCGKRRRDTARRGAMRQSTARTRA